MQLDIKKSNQPKEAGHFASFIETWGINAEVNNNDVVKPKSKSTHELFSKTRGMWKDREIDVRQLRRDAWNGDKIYKTWFSTPKVSFL
ncbi:hypothetical protein FACS189432_02360 [Bacteroidia bacterium]|nr:hypothetical protein FACS189426_00420 [Bacteroidia bacterium]GHT26940.1 hypothetical protein FACS189432_02360 [Bacteroidia bacterium]